MGLDTILFLITIGLILAFLIYAITFQAWQARLRQPEPSARQKARLAISCVLFPLILLAGFLLAASSVFVVPILSVLALAVLPVALVIMAFAHLIPVIPRWIQRLNKLSVIFGNRVIRFAMSAYRYPAGKFREFYQSLTALAHLVMVRNPFLILDDDDTSNLLHKIGIRHDRDSILLTLASDPAGDLRVRLRAVERLGENDCIGSLADLAADPAVPTNARLRSAEILQEKGLVEDAAGAWIALAGQSEVVALSLKAAHSLYDLERSQVATGILKKLLKKDGLTQGLRVHIARKLAEFGDQDTARAELLPLARSLFNDPGIRLAAAGALGHLGEVEEAAVALVGLAAPAKAAPDGQAAAPKPAPWIRRIAIQTLGELAQFERLLALAQNRDLDIDLRIESCLSLERKGQRDETIRAWLSIYDQEGLPLKTRIAVAAPLGRLGHEAVKRMLLNVGRDGQVEARTRLQAAQTLLDLGYAQDARSIFLLLANRQGDPQVSQQATWALRRNDQTD